MAMPLAPTHIQWTTLLILLHLLLCRADLPNGQSLASMMERSSVSNSVGSRTLGNLQPEPCYPPPCPGYTYDRSTTEVDSTPMLGDYQVVPAESYGEGLDHGYGQALPPETRAFHCMPPDDCSQSASVAPVSEEFPVRLKRSIIVLPPPPPPFSPQKIECCDGDPNIESKSAESIGRMKRLLSRINTMDKSVEEHENWVLAARKAVEKVSGLVKEAEQDRVAIQNERQELTFQKEELARQVRRQLLEGDLKQAAENLNQLELESQQFKRADQLMTKEKDGIQKKIEQVASKLKIAKDQIQNKLIDIDSSNSVGLVAKQFKDYIKK